MKHPLARAAAIGAAVLATVLAGSTPALAAEPAPPPAGSPQASTPAERASAMVRPSITYLTGAAAFFVDTGNGEVLNPGKPYTTSWSCTGFGINPAGYIATAGHCVDPDQVKSEFFASTALELAKDPAWGMTADQTYAAMMSKWTLRGDTPGSPPVIVLNAVSGSTSGTSTSGQKLPARVVDFRPGAKGDVALLKVEAAGFPSTLLGGDADVQIGTSVLSIGYPGSVDQVTDLSLEPSVKDGRVSSKKTADGFPVYETSAAVSPGMSGGPTVDLGGTVIGINSRKPAEETQAFNLVAPSSGMSELLARNGVRNELGPEDTAFRDGLRAYYSGHFSRAMDRFDAVLRTQPQHAQANRFKGLAAKARDQFGDVVDPPAPILGLSPVLFWPLVGGGALLLVVLTLLLVLMRRRRSGPTADAPGHPGPQPGQPVPYGQPPHLYTPQYEPPAAQHPGPPPAAYHPAHPQSAYFAPPVTYPPPTRPWAGGPQYPPTVSDRVPSYVQDHRWAQQQRTWPVPPPGARPMVPEQRTAAGSESADPNPA